jgi:hypothetical protein
MKPLRHTKAEPRTYVALARIKKSDGAFYEIGDEVPEAKTWRNPHSWVLAGRLGPIYDEPVPKKASAAPKPEPAPEKIEAEDSKGKGRKKKGRKPKGG